MPLREGNVASLMAEQSSRFNNGTLCRQLLEQMLDAFEYLDSMGVCHRDVKPQNILYSSKGQGKYHFQLADFGLANVTTAAEDSCGTSIFMAPELVLGSGQYGSPRTPKIDVWSLFVTIIHVYPGIKFPPSRLDSYHDLLKAVREAAVVAPLLSDMAQENPKDRCSAKQMRETWDAAHNA